MRAPGPSDRGALVRTVRSPSLVGMKPPADAIPLMRGFVPGAVHQDAPHRFGGGGKEMSAAVPIVVARPGQPQPG